MRRTAFAFLVTGLPLLSGCISNTPIEGSDYHAPSSLVRASFGVGEPRPKQLRIQATLVHQEGKFEDGVEDGKTASLNGVDFDGPTRLDGKMRMDLAHIGVVFPLPMLAEQMRLEPWAGGTAFRARLDVSDATKSATRKTSADAAPSGGVALVWYTPARHFGLRAGVDATWAGETSFLEQEGFAFYAPTKNVELLLGYRHLEYKYSGSTDSNVYTTMEGPSAGVNIRF